jgi:sugar (pentulose or hexulose) kinase
MAADMFGKPLRITDFENAVFGAALLAAYGAGQIQDLGEAVGAIRYREVAPAWLSQRCIKRSWPKSACER